MTIDVFTLPVHPAAEIFPMLDEEELQALADDIATNGLRQPLVIKDGVLVDGRNRREACKRAKVTPTTEELNGADPVAYILSANIARRHLSKGQRAMAVAKLYPEPAKGGRGKKGQTQFDGSGEYLKRARTVLRILPTLADEVLAGGRSLNDAYQAAQQIEAEQQTEPKRLLRLREQAPDLADLVVEERMKLAEAEAAYKERQAKQQRQRDQIRGFLIGVAKDCEVVWDNESTRKGLIDWLREDGAVLDNGVKGVKVIKKWREKLDSILEAI